MSSRSWASSCVWLALCGCVPPEPPGWVVTQPISRGFQTRVVEPGPYSAGLLVPFGQTRTEPLPLDTLEVEWFTAAPPDVTLQPPIWLVCPGFLGCIGTAALEADALAPCPVPLPLTSATPCRLGVGERLRVALGDVDTLVLDPTIPLDSGVTKLLAVTSWDDAIDPETCVERLFHEPRAGLERCLLAERQISFGPQWRIQALFPELFPGGFLAELLEEPPDTNPVIVWLGVHRGSDVGAAALLVRDGETIEVRAGEQITVTPVFNANAAESYYVEETDEDGATSLVVEREEVRVRALLSEEVEGYEGPASLYDDEFVYRWIAPEHAGPVTLFVQAGDDRAGRAYATLRTVSVDATGGAP